MGELIFVLVIVVQGIAGVAAAINKKKRDRERAEQAELDGGSKEATGKAGSPKATAANSGGASFLDGDHPMAARLDRASAARASREQKKRQDETNVPSGLDAPKPMKPTPTQARVASAKVGSFDERLARRREQIAQLRARAGQPTPATAPPPPVVRTTAAPTRMSVPAPAPAPQAASPRVPTGLPESRAARAGSRPDEAQPLKPVQGNRSKRRKRGALQRAQLKGLLGSSSDLKRAIVLKELLDAPVALRTDH